jgi:hypothetical protein
MSLGRLLLVLGLVFGITLAAVVGSRMSAEAMAVVVGVVCGVAAGIPTSALLLLAMGRRERRRPEADQWASRPGPSPPVVVIQGGAPQALPPGHEFGYWPTAQPMAHARRDFHVVGDEDLADDGWR